MSIADTAASAAKKLVLHNSKKVRRKITAPVLEKAEPIRMKNEQGTGFNAGYAVQEVMPKDVTSQKYCLAGYKMGNYITGVYDPTTVRAMWIDCDDGQGIVLVSADIIGLTGYEVKEIRDSLADFREKSGCKFIDISCTHTHAGIDTVGYWGKLPKTGKNKAYMQQLEQAIRQVCIDAYNSRKSGKLYMGCSHVPDAIKDGRPPYVVNDKLTRLRFVPDDGTEETWFLNYSAHPNTLGGGCTKISADYPYFMRERINQKKKTNVLFSVGAIAATNIADLAEDRNVRTKMGGEMLGDAALSIDNDEELKPEILLVNQPYYAPISNSILALMSVIHVCNSLKYPCEESELGIALLTEMTYLNIGGKQILILPGEIFAELVYGGYASAEESATGKGPEINPVPLCEIAQDENLIIFGVSNDMTGYIVPPNDAILHPTQAYLSSVRDRFDRNHYHETNSMGMHIAHTVADTFKGIMESVQKVNAQ